jgi:FMN-dependent oxidoreductase (nitrilotriacetate monooxygenase family)
MAKMGERRMVMVGFMQAQNSTTIPASWRHAATMPDFLTAEYYQRIARTLEDGLFDLAFFDDRLAVPDSYGGSHATAVTHGVMAVKLDPIAPMMAMALATRHLGVAATMSTTYHHPFHVARLFASIDHMTGGRASWNIVTSLNRSEAANFGFDEALAHDARYDRADEFLEIVTGLWGSWEDDAVTYDRSTGLFADPSKVHRLDYRGAWLSSRGPASVPPSPQGHPVLLQAGASGRGRAFAVRWAELMFVIAKKDVAAARADYAEIKRQIAEAGRDPARVGILPAAVVVVAETRELARQKLEYIERLFRIEDAVELFSEALGLDLSHHDLDDRVTLEELASATGTHSVLERAVAKTGVPNPTVRELVQATGYATLEHPLLFCGSPSDVADSLEEWFAAEACDGFVLVATHVPGTYEDFTRLVVPELQRRGVYRREYAGTTLRENLGLPRPAADGRTV